MAAFPVVFWFRVGTSPAWMVSHAGGCATASEDCSRRNFRVFDVSPASRAGAPADPP